MGEPVYNLGVGGYGPLEYLHLLRERASQFRPEVVIVGLYFGNDLKDAYDAAHYVPYWHEWAYSEAGGSPKAKGVEKPELFLGGLRSILVRRSVLYGLVKLHLAGPMRSLRGRKQAASVPPERQFFWVDPAKTKVRTAFTPQRRLEVLDQNDPTIAEGLLITKDALLAISTYVRSVGGDLLVALIPTKEEVYCDYLRSLGNSLPRTFQDLCDQERKVRAELAMFFEIKGIRYVDTSQRLKEAVALHIPIYPRDGNGHPSAAGYRAIAEAIYAALESLEKETAVPK